MKISSIIRGIKLTNLAYDLIAGAGLCVCFAGLWWVYSPAALILFGLVALVLGVVGARSKARADAVEKARAR